MKTQFYTDAKNVIKTGNDYQFEVAGKVLNTKEAYERVDAYGTYWQWTFFEHGFLFRISLKELKLKRDKYTKKLIDQAVELMAACEVSKNWPSIFEAGSAHEPAFFNEWYEFLNERFDFNEDECEYIGIEEEKILSQAYKIYSEVN